MPSRPWLVCCARGGHPKPTAVARRVERRVLGGIAAASVVLVAGVAPTSAAPAPLTATFGCTDGAQSWTVPEGVTSVAVTVDGASGAVNNFLGRGRGGRAAATISVGPGPPTPSSSAARGLAVELAGPGSAGVVMEAPAAREV